MSGDCYRAEWCSGFRSPIKLVKSIQAQRLLATPCGSAVESMKQYVRVATGLSAHTVYVSPDRRVYQSCGYRSLQLVYRLYERSGYFPTWVNMGVRVRVLDGEIRHDQWSQIEALSISV